MRRPSLGQNEDDLSRLTSAVSPTNASINSAHNENNNNHNSNNKNNGSNCTKLNENILNGGKTSLYLPKILNSSEWQNCRKRKERQDSTSSITQDRKLVRSNSEEHVPNCQEVIRRVSSHEDFKVKPIPLQESKNENIIRNDLVSNADGNKLQKPINKSSDKNRISPSRLNNGGLSAATAGNDEDSVNGGVGGGIVIKCGNSSVSNNNHSISNNNYARKDHEDIDGEHERRRNSERFAKTRVTPGRKSSSPRKPSKHSSTKVIDRDENAYKYDIKNLRYERRGFVSKTERSDKKRDDSETQINISTYDSEETNPLLSDYSNDENLNSENDISISSPETTNKREALPWDQESYNDEEKPIICRRYADRSYDYANNAMNKFIKPSSGTSNGDIISLNNNNNNNNINNNNKMQRDLMQKLMPQSSLSQQNTYYNITPDERVKQINKRLQSLKKKITQFEENFVRENGYRPSQADKTNDKSIKNATAEIHKLRREKAQIKSDPMLAMGYTQTASGGIRSNKNGTAAGGPIVFLNDEKKIGKMKDTLVEIEKRLTEKREGTSRSEKLDDLSADELNDEKTAVQRGLLYLESIFGRPNTRDERDVARPLYDRYRSIKRMVNRNNSLSGNFGMVCPPDLPTILEHEAMAFTGGTPQSTDVTPPSATSCIQSPSDTSTIDTSCNQIDEISTETTTTTTTSSSVNDNIHSMSINELWNLLDCTREEKKELRRTIKDYEHMFEETNGRKMLKIDRKPIEDTYALYKQKKAKLRLLDALVKKQMAN